MRIPPGEVTQVGSRPAMLEPHDCILQLGLLSGLLFCKVLLVGIHLLLLVFMRLDHELITGHAHNMLFRIEDRVWCCLLGLDLVYE